MPITVPPAALWSTSSLMRRPWISLMHEVEVGHALGPVLLATGRPAVYSWGMAASSMSWASRSRPSSVHMGR